MMTAVRCTPARVRRITLREFLAELKAQGVEPIDFAFR